MDNTYTIVSLPDLLKKQNQMKENWISCKKKSHFNQHEIQSTVQSEISRDKIVFGCSSEFLLKAQKFFIDEKGQ